MDIKALAGTGLSLLLIMSCTTSTALNTPASEVVVKDGSNKKAVCQNDPHSLALRDALSPFYHSALSYELKNVLHEMIMSGQYKSFAEVIRKVSLDVSKVKVRGQIETDSTVVYAQRWRTVGPSTRVLDVTYSSAQAPSSSRLHWIISQTEEGHAVTLNQMNSFIDGMSLEFLLGTDGNKDPKVSSCISQALIESYYKHTIEKVTDADNLRNWRNSRTIGYGWGDNFANSTGPVCKYSIFNVADKLVSRVLVSCSEQ